MHGIASRSVNRGLFLFLFPACVAADIVSDEWPRKIRELPASVPVTVTSGVFKITVLEPRIGQTGATNGTGGATRELIVQNTRTASKRVFTTQSIAIGVLESFGGWPQFEIWTRPGPAAWCRSLYRLTVRGYEEVRTDEFTELATKATDKDRTARAPGDDGEVIYYVETRSPKT